METKQKIWAGVAIALFVIGAALLTAGLVVELSVFPGVMNSAIETGKVLGKNSDGSLNDFTKTFVNPSYKTMMQFWTFDYKNTIGIMNRAIYPDTVEKGPYSYTETLINTNINFTADGEKMTYSQATQYNFNPAKSCPTCDPYKDKVTVPDISFVVALDAIIQQLDNFVAELAKNNNVIFICNLLHTRFNKNYCESIPKLLEKELGTAFDIFNTGPFVTVTVDQLLFSGYDAPLVDKVVNRLVDIFNGIISKPLFHKVPPVRVTLNPENGTTGYLYTVLTGKQDYQKSGFIQSFTNTTNMTESSKGSSLPKAWWPNANKDGCLGDYGDHALSLVGTNGDFFKSHIQRTDKLPLYVENLCRSAHLLYEKDVSFKGIDGYRFLLPSLEFDYSLPENCGFCNPLKYGAYNSPVGSKCFPKGLLDISGCNQGNPIVISKPHFYQADPIVQAFVPRFRPEYDNDETTLDIEPITGSVLSAMKRLQINMFMNQWPRIGAYSVLRPGAYPLVWLNESAVMDDGTQNQLKSQLFTPKKIVVIASWTAVGVGGFLMVVGLLIIVVQFCVVNKMEKKDE